MAIPTALSRFAEYHSRHGWTATWRRLALAAKRSFFAGREVLFYCDLSEIAVNPAPHTPITVERKQTQSEINPEILERITDSWNPSVTQNRLKERFRLGAVLWLVRCEGDFAGYGWTLQGRTVAPHYFSLAQQDIHFFDFFIFPRFRGRGLNPLLIREMLRTTAAECKGRAFIEAAEWNTAQLASLARTPFLRLGLAKKVSLFGHALVWWSQPQNPPRTRHLESDVLSTRPCAMVADVPHPQGGFDSGISSNAKPIVDNR
jgi:GNAT superfamily N-acetyltransferase